MPTPSRPPGRLSGDALLAALAACLAAGDAPPAALERLAEASPPTATDLRVAAAQLRGGRAVVAVLGPRCRLGPREVAPLLVGERRGALPAGAAVAVMRRRLTRDRTRALVAGVLGPALLALLLIATVPLPEVLLGPARWTVMLWPPVVTLSLVAALLLGSALALRRDALRARLARLPLLGGPGAAALEAELAAALAASPEPVAWDIAEAVVGAPAPPDLRVLAAGAARRGTLAADLRAHAEARAALSTQRAVTLARVSVYLLMTAIVVWSLTTLLAFDFAAALTRPGALPNVDPADMRELMEYLR